jgi:hypothetical protein
VVCLALVRRGRPAPQLHVRSTGGSAVVLAMVVGYSAGVLGGYLLFRRITSWLSRSCSKPRLVLLFGAVGGLAAALPAVFLSTVVGGTLGGAYGEVATQALGLGSSGIPLGLGAGLALVMAAVVGVGAFIGAGVARLIASIWSNDAAI